MPFNVSRMDTSIPNSQQRLWSSTPRLPTSFHRNTRERLPRLYVIYVSWLQAFRADLKLDVGYQLLGEGTKKEGCYSYYRTSICQPSVEAYQLLLSLQDISKYHLIPALKRNSRLPQAPRDAASDNSRSRSSA